MCYVHVVPTIPSTRLNAVKSFVIDSGVVAETQWKAEFDLLSKMSGVDVLSAPRVATRRMP